MERSLLEAAQLFSNIGSDSFQCTPTSEWLAILIRLQSHPPLYLPEKESGQTLLPS